MSTLAGTGVLARALLRRTRWSWLAWLLVLASMFPATAAAYRTAVPAGPAGEATAASLASQPTMRAILGPPYDLLQVGSFVMWRVGTVVVAVAAVMALLGVVDATRADEEGGRLELLRSGTVGRHAPLAAALLVTLGACGLLGLASGLAMLGPSGDPRGSTMLGLAVALGAAVWAGVGAVAAQISESARGARGLALSTLGAAYVARALGDGATPRNPLLQWASPLEWPALSQPYAGNRWSVLLLPGALTALLITAAAVLEGRRDHGAGLRAAGLGPARATWELRDAATLATRLGRTTVRSWIAGLAIFAYGMGTLAASMDDLLRESPDLADRFRRMGGGAASLTDAFYVAMIGILVPLVALFSLQLFGLLRREEAHGRAELLLSTDTSRTRLLLSHLAPATWAPTMALVAIGIFLALPRFVGDVGIFATLLAAALSQLPGVLVITGLAVAVHGWAPRLAVLPWVVVGWSLLMGWVGVALGLPDRVVRATPFATLSRPPADSFDAGPALVCLGLAVLLTMLGLVGYRRRDLQAG
ncbi:ABC transporter permease [Arsenicicoccus dermatophilus]|uniref:ABC transporter permease n=1 Tax=Arsenicicoccus dermatophilus TaxID=1076331 RepID=UPI0039170189